MQLSQSDYAVLLAVEKGYCVNRLGEVFSKRGNKLKLIKHSIHLKQDGDEICYMRFTVRDGSRTLNVIVHKMVAYTKYGIKAFKEGVCVRHLNSISTDNKWENIAIGTQSDNHMDIPKEKRIQKAIHASSFAKKHDHEQIVKMHQSGLSYSRIMFEMGIKSKGTISFIIKRSLESKR